MSKSFKIMLTLVVMMLLFSGVAYAEYKLGIDVDPESTEITAVYSNSAAEKHGLKKGDSIYRINNKNIKSNKQLFDVLNNIPNEAWFDIYVLRNRNKLTFKIIREEYLPTVEVVTPKGTVTFKNLRFGSKHAYGWYPYAWGEIVNNTSVTWQKLSFDINVTDANGIKLTNTPLSISFSGLQPGQTTALGYDGLGENVLGLRQSNAYNVDISYAGGSFTNFVSMKPEEILPARSNWLGQKVVFYQSGEYHNVYSILSADSLKLHNNRVDVDNLHQGNYYINDCYKLETEASTGAKFYWKIVDGISGKEFWYVDDSYADSLKTGSSASDGIKPFFLQSELDMTDQKLKEYRTFIGTTLWSDLTRHYVAKSLKLGHLEEVSIADIRATDNYAKLQVDLKRSDGSIVTWTESSSLFRDAKPLSDILKKAFYTENPYHLHPDWDNSVWYEIRRQYVILGWDKEKCLMSWGRPKQQLTKTSKPSGIEEHWLYSQHSYLIFKNGSLSKIQP